MCIGHIPMECERNGDMWGWLFRAGKWKSMEIGFQSTRTGKEDGNAWMWRVNFAHYDFLLSAPRTQLCNTFLATFKHTRHSTDPKADRKWLTDSTGDWKTPFPLVGNIGDKFNYESLPAIHFFRSNEIKSATAMAQQFANNDRKGIQICRGVL